MAKFVHVVLKMPKPFAKLLIFAKAVLTAMTGNTKFPNATALVAALAAAVTALDKAINGGTSTDRLAAREAVRDALEHVADNVQGVAEEGNGGTVDISAIRALVESAGLALRKVGTRPKLTLGAKNGPSSGSVILTAPANPKRDPHEWQNSTDQHTWSPLSSSLKAKVTVTGLPVGVTEYFRHRSLTKAGYTDWSDPIMIVVK
jgi:hypothetical protein